MELWLLFDLSFNIYLESFQSGTFETVKKKTKQKTPFFT